MTHQNHAWSRNKMVDISQTPFSDEHSDSMSLEMELNYIVKMFLSKYSVLFLAWDSVYKITKETENDAM